MKKLLLLSMTAMLMAACGNEEETKEKGASKVETETSASTEEKKEVSTEEKAKETKKIVEKKDSTEEKNLSGKYPYMDEDGHIDILSDAFINAYTRQNRISEFAGITQGMEVTEVEKMYGKPTHDGKSRISSNHERFGDIAIENTDYKVSQIYINSSTPHTREEILAKYGVATEVWKSDDGEVISLVYNNNHSNGFQLILHFDKNDNFIAMEQQPETYQMTGELIVSDDDAPSANETQANKSEVSCSYDNSPEVSNERQQKLRTIAIANKCLDDFEKNPSDTESQTIAWNLMIRGSSPGSFSGYPDVRAAAEKVYDRLGKYDERALEFKDDFINPWPKE
ncbi:hypothetical protein BHU61_00470 [Macrococcus epidermidis]|uniref:Lipoprotein n=1 Tax=Macrococcus epidermidis TaxID=1902580 RepID=A0A327ZU88_9STAP|nr:hypothetical protein [Macrococcus epidermidis]RAK45953.1 hypothetical protein BHU61_00470 [Macrococcus epidermidis]